ncbi:MAG: hypothetical protein MJ252_22920 [archaeon]|nr:hypothetical protein [archaeon]
MSFFSRLFSGSSDKIEPAIIDNTAKLYLQRDKSGQRIPFKIGKTQSCDDIVQNLKRKDPKLKLPENGIFLITDQDNNVEMQLGPKEKPYIYLDGTSNLFCYIKKEDKAPEPKKTTNYEYFMSKFYPDIKKKESKQEIFLTGDLYRWSRKKKTFRKKKCSLNENEFRITSSKKGFNVQIGSVTSMSGSLVNRPPSLSKEKDFLSEKYLIEIIYNARDPLILRFKKQNDYDLWYKTFDEVISKRKERQLDREFNEMLDSYSCTIGINEQMILNNCFSLRQILSVSSTRHLFYSLVNNRPLTDLFEVIIEYKICSSKMNYIEAWKKLKILLSQISIESNEGIVRPREEYKEIINEEEVGKMSKLCKTIDEIITSIKSDVLFEVAIKTKLKDVLKKDIFDSLYQNIIEVCFTKVFQKNFVEEEWQDETIVTKLTFLLSHYMVNNYGKIDFSYITSSR